MYNYRAAYVIIYGKPYYHEVPLAYHTTGHCLNININLGPIYHVHDIFYYTQRQTRFIVITSNDLMNLNVELLYTS